MKVPVGWLRALTEIPEPLDDVDALRALNDQLYQSCVSCHTNYRPGYGRRGESPLTKARRRLGIGPRVARLV